MSREQVIQEALALSEEDREMLAEDLLLSLKGVSSEQIEKAWIDEAKRRLDEVRAGTAILHDADEVIEELRKKYSR